MKIQQFNYKQSQYNRPNQKWICGLLDTGECCELGPSSNGKCRNLIKNPDNNQAYFACTPVRTIRNKRLHITRLTSFFIVLAIALFYLNDKQGMLDPGALSAQHQGSSQCIDCHTNFDDDISQWIHQLLSFEITPQNCTTCHKVLEKNANLPHSLKSEVLQEITQSKAHSIKSNSLFRASIWENKEPRCAVCHSEHKGLDNRLISISDQQCHNCHKQQFDTFDTNHPEFNRYPYLKRTNIQFNHNSHFTKHFKEDSIKQNSILSCVDCHGIDDKGDQMLVRGYEITCGACHENQIRGTDRVTKGIEVLALPQIDTAELLAQGYNVGEWSNTGSEAIPNYMKLLLSSNDSFADALAKVNNLTLYDLSGASSKQLEAVSILAWEVKLFFYKLSSRGPDFIQIDIKPSSDLTGANIAELLELLPRSSLMEMVKVNFPNLDQEIQQYIENPSKTIANVNYSNNTAKVESQSISTNKSNKDISITDDELNFSFDDDDWLSSDDDFSDDDTFDDSIEDESINKSYNIATSNEEWANNGGWYLENSALYYRTTGHADSMLKNWLETTSLGESTYSKAIFNSLKSKNSIGNCTKCHSVTNETINWMQSRETNEATFTHFKHSVHINSSRKKINSCKGCHKFNMEAKYNEAFESDSSHDFESNFMPMTIEQCSKCHLQEKAGNNCIQCHNYHILNTEVD